jgi:hypothetical protein
MSQGEGDRHRVPGAQEQLHLPSFLACFQPSFIHLVRTHDLGPLIPFGVGEGGSARTTGTGAGSRHLEGGLGLHLVFEVSQRKLDQRRIVGIADTSLVERCTDNLSCSVLFSSVLVGSLLFCYLLFKELQSRCVRTA